MFTVSPHNKYLCESGSLNNKICYVCALEARQITDKRYDSEFFQTFFQRVSGLWTEEWIKNLKGVWVQQELSGVGKC